MGTFNRYYSMWHRHSNIALGGEALLGKTISEEATGSTGENCNMRKDDTACLLIKMLQWQKTEEKVKTVAIFVSWALFGRRIISFDWHFGRGKADG